MISTFPFKNILLATTNLIIQQLGTVDQSPRPARLKEVASIPVLVQVSSIQIFVLLKNKNDN